MSQPSEWVTTTHDWGRTVDQAHLEQMRAALTALDAGGRRHLILEVLSYAQDEAAVSGRTGTVVVTYVADGSVTVDDDGRGTDTRRDEDGTIIRKPVMSTPDVRFTDPVNAPLLPDGLPRRGMSSVAAVSDILTHENHRDTGSWSQIYRFGLPDDALAAVKPRTHPGTVVTFHANITGPARLAESDLHAYPDIHIVVQ